VEVTDLLPVGVTFVTSSTTQGSYISGTGVWTVGSVSNAASDTLSITATVAAGTGGTTIVNTGSVTAADQADGNPANDSDTSSVTVQSIDLAVTKTVDDPAPNEGGTVVYTVALTNNGPDTATGVEVTDLLPAGVTFVTSATTQGTYVSGTGVWAVGSILNAASDTLSITATVDAGTGGTTIVNTASITSADQADPNPANDSDTASITVQGVDLADQADPNPTNDSDTAPIAVEGVDLAVTKTVDDPAPNEGGTVVYTVTLTNNDTDTATGVEVTDLLPAGMTFVSSATTQGSYVSGTGVWAVGNVPNATSDTLSITATVNGGTGGLLIVNTASITSADQADPDGANDSDSAGVTVQLPAFQAVVHDQSETTLLPGAGGIEVFRFDVVNTAAVAETVSAITLTNGAVGPGSQSQLDAEWLSLQLAARSSSGLALPLEAQRASSTFTGGLASFTGLTVAVPPGDRTTFIVTSGASPAARDGDVLDLLIADSTAVAFTRPVNLTGTWPLDPAGAFPVDGMAAVQIKVLSSPLPNLLTGSARNLAFEAVVPPNGYEPDVLENLNVRNDGTAQPGSDIEKVEAWWDSDDDGLFEPAGDDASGLLGEMLFTGDRWERTGLSLAIPDSGRRVFLSCDISSLATEGRTVRFGVPAAPSVGVGMASANDGPLDAPVQSPVTQTISSNFASTSLSDSYLNFPNPFAAGREETSFAFFLPQPAKVTLRLWSVRGKGVKTLIDGVPLAAGVHQETTWDGRNGRGDVVVNGVYFAEIAASFDDGTSQRHVLKVAVVR
jgi:uncharacterized repeat protein (TIGR01451 family)